MSGDGEGQDQRRGEISPQDREAIRQRSQDIGRKLDALKGRSDPAREEENRRRGAAFGQAFRYAAELVVGVGVGVYRLAAGPAIGLSTLANGFIRHSGFRGGSIECDPRGAEGAKGNGASAKGRSLRA